MGGQPSRSSKPPEIYRIGIDEVPQPQQQPEVKGAEKAIVVLSSGKELCRENVCELLQDLIRERAAFEREDVTNSKKQKKERERIKQDLENCLKFLGEDLVFVLKDVERREELLSLDREALEELIRSDQLVVPDESYVLLAVGAWAERRAHEEEMRDREKNGMAADPKAKIGPKEDVDLRGSDGLFMSLGRGAAKMLEAKDVSKENKEGEGNKDEKEATTTTTPTKVEKAEEEPKETTTNQTSEENNEKTTGEEIEGDGKNKSAVMSEAEINLRGTAGLYATLASAYVNMISDEEMARQLQDEELEEDKIRRKMMEEEDERLARALQEGEISDGGTLPQDLSVDTKKEEEEEEDMEPIPEYKLTPEYIDRIKKHMEPFFPLIRYSNLPLNILNTLANEKLVPTQYLTEAYKYHMLVSNNMMDLVDKQNPRFKRRRYICNVEWDRKWHGQHIQISADGKVALKLNSSWYSLACATEGYQQGKHFWAVKVEGDEAYIGVTQKGNTSLDNYLGGNYQSWAFRTSYKYSSAHGNGYYGEPFGRGDIIGVLLDMDAGSLTFFKNGKNLGVCFTNLPRTEKMYPAVGWRAGQMSLVDVDMSSYSGMLTSLLS